MGVRTGRSADAALQLAEAQKRIAELEAQLAHSDTRDPLARTLLVFDAYHAMTSDRPYRQAMPHADAIAELGKHAGSQFDPEVIQALVGYLYGRRQAGAAV